ncbi:MAG: GAF domain-containing protein [Eubacteriales bacterium]|nr:GAF domain-containing protein [Eubacteriales bacterium]
MDKNIFSEDSITRLIDIGIALTAEKDYNRLLEKILAEARNITRADGGTLYILEKDKLYHKIMQTASMGVFKGGDGQPIGFPPVAMELSNVSAYTAIMKKNVNIPDVYHSQLFDFSGPKTFDKATGYVTRSMLVIPLINREDKVIGVLQLINALDENGEIMEFEKKQESIVASLASQAGIAIENMQYVEEIKHFFESFVEVMAAAIDARTPYNANHSQSIALLIEKFAKHLNVIEEGSYKDTFFDGNKINELVTAAWLHDIGKIAVPIEILDKPNRLGDRTENLLLRLDLIEAKLRLHYLEALRALLEKGADHEEQTRIEEQWQEDSQYLKETREFILEVDRPSTFVDREKSARLQAIKNKKLNGITEEIIDEKDLENLSIVKGTLTDHERSLIENHVKVTERLLSKMDFPDYLENVPDWAVKHHEFLDGTGYCTGCSAGVLPLEVRMLTILDIYDALTAEDRPYKAGMPREKAFAILGAMAEEGKLDKELTSVFVRSHIWEKPERKEPVHEE